MPIQLAIQLAAQYGLPLVMQLIQMWESGGTVSSTQWQTLITAAQVDAKTEASSALKASGIDPNSATAQAILALIK